MKRPKKNDVHVEIESDRRPTVQKRRRRAPRVKPLPNSMRDPRHDPDAAIAAIKAAFMIGGTVVQEAEAIQHRNEGHVKQIPASKPILTRDSQIRYRSSYAKTGPGQARSEVELMIGDAETAFAREVNEIRKIAAFEGGKSRASKIAAEIRTQAAVPIRARVCELFDASPLAPRNRTSAIARTMAREGYAISERRVREILAQHRNNLAQ